MVQGFVAIRRSYAILSPMKWTYKQPTRQRLDVFLTTELTDISRSQIQKLVKLGQVTVNGQSTEVHHWLKKDDLVEYTVAKKPKIDPKATKRSLNVKFEDDDVVVIDKPSGLLVHPTQRNEAETLISLLLKEYPQLKKFDDPIRPGLVHRLDKDVSGLMIVALNPKSFASLKNQFQERTIDKRYTALVHGSVLKDVGTITTNLLRDKKTGLTKALSAKPAHDEAIEGREAITHYEVKQRYVNYTLLEIKLITGRTHQIRAHLQSIGHSIVGDTLYVTGDIRKKKKIFLTRPFLHASSLQWLQLDGSKKKCTSPLPAELKKFLTSLQDA
jgi:23S rRNA pseudouridine1911/1915/1917 synthase